jgi:hypothetical protein
MARLNEVVEKVKTVEKISVLSAVLSTIAIVLVLL